MEIKVFELIVVVTYDTVFFLLHPKNRNGVDCKFSPNDQLAASTKMGVSVT